MSLLIINKKAELNYQVLKKFTAGIVLSGQEVKALRSKTGSLNGAFVTVKLNQKNRSELWLKNMTIPPYQSKNAPDSYNPEKERKLLVEKRDIVNIEKELKTKGTTLIPLSIKTVSNLIKVDFALVRGKKKYDKREDLKKKTAQREAKKEAKAQLK